jgi:hypothetical protein
MDLPYDEHCAMCRRIETIDDICALEWVQYPVSQTSCAKRARVTKRYVRRLSRVQWFRIALAHRHIKEDLSNYVMTLRTEDAAEEQPTFERVLLI